MKYYNLRCKFEGQKRFALVDWSTGKQVALKFYATMFTEKDKKLVETVDIPSNPNIEFKWSEIS